ncbi:MAG: hypothetical protein BWX92_01504 [Deltaproteobacteria bacterium ADurb.Bin135]|nr:MAG: hypothetical protein BWX92_01504 [Deltaproteobacteria bacterium ADurb.Bin135]
MKIDVPEYDITLDFPEGTAPDVVNEYIKTKYPKSAIALPSEEAWYNPIRSAKAIGTRIASAFNGGVSNIINGAAKLNKMLDDLGSRRMADLMQQGYKPDADMLAAIDHQKISRDVLQPKLEATVNYFKDNEIALRRAANAHGINFIEETIADTVGGFLPYSVEFMLNVPWAVGIGMADAHEQGESNLLWAGIKSGVHRYVLGRIFHGVNKLPKWAAVPSTGLVFGADAYYSTGGDWRETAKAFGSGLFLSSLSPNRFRKDSATGKELHELPLSEFSKKVSVDSEGRVFIKATGEEIPFLDHQKKQRTQLSNYEWISEAHENILRLAKERGDFIPEEALEGHGILRDIWKMNDEINMPNNNNNNNNKSLAVDAEMSTSTKVKGEDGATTSKSKNTTSSSSSDKIPHRVQMSDADVLRLSEKITESLDKEATAKAQGEPPHMVNEFSNIQTFGDVARVIDTIAADKIAKDSVGGVRTLESVREAAKARVKEAGFDINELRLLKEALHSTPEKVTAWMDFLVKDSEVLCKLRDEANTTKTPEALAAFQEHLIFTSEVTALLKGISADSSRILGSRRIRIDGASIDKVTVENALRKFDGLNPGDAGDMVGRIKKLKGSPLGNLILEYTNINILASPTVHMFNFLGNTIKPFVEVGQTYSQVAFGRLMKGSKDYVNRVTLGEANAYAAAMTHTAAEIFIRRPILGIKKVINGIPEYLEGKKFTDILKDIIDAPEKLEQHLNTSGIDPSMNKGIEAGNAGIISSAYLKETKTGKLFDRLVGESTFGEVMWKALDVLGATGRDASYGLLTVFDKPFKELHYNGMLAREVYRASLQKEFKTIAERTAWIEKTSEDVMKYRMKRDFTVTDADQLRLIQHIDKQALTAARDGTWQADLSETGQAMEKLLSKNTWTKVLGVRFFKTPVNLLKEIGRNSPFSILMENTRADLLGRNGIRAQTKAFARQLTGGLIALGSMSLVSNDIITGSHPPEQREALLAAGIPEYSIRIGDKYYQYNRLDPYLIPLAVIADCWNAIRYLDSDRGSDVWAILTMSLGNSIFNKTWATQLGDIFAAIRDPKREGFRYIKNLTTSMLPASGMARFINAQNDPLMRETESIVEYVRNTYIPTSNRPSLDWLGMEKEHHRRIGMKIDSPVDKDPIYLEAARLGMHVEPIGDTISMMKGEVKLTPEEHWGLQKSLDEDFHMREFLNDYISRDSYKMLSDEAKEESLKKIISIFHRRAKAAILSEEDEIRNLLLQDTQRRVNLLTAPPSQPSSNVNEYIRPHIARHLSR